MTEMQLRASVFEDLNAILDNEDAMRKLRKFLSRLRKEATAASTTECSETEDAVCEQEAMVVDEKTEVLEDIREGLREVKAAREGKIKLQSARDFLHEIRS